MINYRILWRHCRIGAHHLERVDYPTEKKTGDLSYTVQSEVGDGQLSWDHLNRSKKREILILISRQRRTRVFDVPRHAYKILWEVHPPRGMTSNLKNESRRDLARRLMKYVWPLYNSLSIFAIVLRAHNGRNKIPFCRLKSTHGPFLTNPGAGCQSWEWDLSNPPKRGSGCLRSSDAAIRDAAGSVEGEKVKGR